jgi:hypothetical protein
MNNLCTIVLISCLNLPFALALNPKKNPSGIIVCPNLENILLHVAKKYQFSFDELFEMAEERASEGVKLRLIRIAGSKGFLLAKEGFQTQEACLTC